ncbi:GntR family transcriptional regulator [Nisaea sp.]|uniref:GntR family transcriptional regulator n=1 Tax=Nisaea sp. TaxID=2024842 RepID=UPI003263137B
MIDSESVMETHGRVLKRRGGTVADIVSGLRHEIISGRLMPGSPLRQEHLAQRFEASRMPVRDALRLLEGEGFVQFDPNRGARVAPVSADDVREIFEMRIAAECLALRIALPELSNTHIDQAAALQDRIESAPASEYGLLNASFHKALYVPAGRPRLLNHIDMLSQAASRYLSMAIVTLDYAGRSNAEHHDLLVACRKRDESRAISCLASHIETAGEALVARLETG